MVNKRKLFLGYNLKGRVFSRTTSTAGQDNEQHKQDKQHKQDDQNKQRRNRTKKKYQ